uniref:Uncharacterized protein n=1 Tax=Anguilla anguilla TaxID=7936 RepID=A0A0E9U9W5_ANGAN
MAIFILSQPT